MEKLKVFLSSTMTELHNERRAVQKELTERGMEVIWFEGFGARPEAAQNAYLEGVQESDIYVGIFWNQYSSATEEEYHEADRLGKSCFIYLKDFDVRREPRLQALIDELGQKYTWKTFGDALTLAKQVQMDIQDWIVHEFIRPREKEAKKVTPPPEPIKPPPKVPPQSLSDWEELWDKEKAHLVLSGITSEEDFVDVLWKLEAILHDLIGRFRLVEFVSEPVLNITAGVVQQIDQEIIGIDAWQRALDLPEKVRALAKVEAIYRAQTLLQRLRVSLGAMKLTIPLLEKEPKLGFRFSDRVKQLREEQEEIVKSFQELRQALGELRQGILRS